MSTIDVPVCTYNVHAKGHQDLPTIAKAGAWIIAMQEGRQTGVDRQVNNMPGWTLARHREDEALPIAWDTRRVELVGALDVICAYDDTPVGSWGAGPPAMKAGRCVVALFRVLATGAELLVVNSHLVPSAGRKKPTSEGKAAVESWEARRQLYRLEVAAIVAGVHGRSTPTALCGDFNGPHSFALLKPIPAAGFKCRAHPATFGRRSIDHVWFRGTGVTAPAARVLHDVKSDHRPLVVTLRIPNPPTPPKPTPAPPKEPAVTAYLVANPPKRRQFKARGTTPSGVFVVHTAESTPDWVGHDSGAEAVAKFIQGRSDPGSYHRLADSDSSVLLVPYSMQAYGDGTGSNPHAIHLSAATQAAKWNQAPKEWREATVRQMARDAADAARWLKKHHGITVPARRISRAESERRVPGFISHGERDPGRRTDPGPSFPWDLFLATYAAELGGTTESEEDEMQLTDKVKPRDHRDEITVKAMLTETHYRSQLGRQHAAAALKQANQNADAITALARRLDTVAPGVAAEVVAALGDRIEVSLSLADDDPEE